MKKSIILLMIASVIISSSLAFTSCGRAREDEVVDSSYESEIQTNGTANDETLSDASDRPMGGTNICQVHSLLSYHGFPTEIQELVGEENFYEWVEESEKSTPRDGCPYPEASIYEFIKHFGISRQELEDVYYNTSTYYNRVFNFDILYSGDPELVDEYYRNIEYFNVVREKRLAVMTLKRNIRDGNPELWTEIFGSNRIAPANCVKRAVDAFGFTKEDMEGMIRSVSMIHNYVYDFNIDALYDGSMDGLSPLEQEAMFCGITDPMTE